MNARKTFWPYGILLSLFAIVIACIVTIIFSSNYPVYEDEFFFEKYQEVKDNYADIESKQKNFDEKFALNLVDLDFEKDKKGRIFYILNQNAQTLHFNLENKQGVSENLKTKVLLTRPHTNKEDRVLNASELKSSAFEVNLPQLEKGRWQLKLKLENSPDEIGFFSFDFLVR